MGKQLLQQEASVVDAVVVARLVVAVVCAVAGVARVPDEPFLCSRQRKGREPAGTRHRGQKRDTSPGGGRAWQMPKSRKEKNTLPGLALRAARTWIQTEQPYA